MMTGKEAAESGEYWYWRWCGHVVTWRSFEDACRGAYEEAANVVLRGDVDRPTGLSIVVFLGRSVVARVQLDHNKDGREPWFGWSPANAVGGPDISPQEYADVIRRRDGRST